MRIDLGDDEQPEIGLIALIDCIFFLLMFFMVATSFKHEAEGAKKGLPIRLPQSAVSPDRQVALDRALAIGVDAKGGLYVDNQPVTLTALRERLRDEAQRDRGVLVRIDGDASVPYQSIIHLVDLCQFEGLTNIALKARRGSTGAR